MFSRVRPRQGCRFQQTGLAISEDPEFMIRMIRYIAMRTLPGYVLKGSCIEPYRHPVHPTL
jgi:hypothetical protein